MIILAVLLLPVLCGCGAVEEKEAESTLLALKMVGLPEDFLLLANLSSLLSLVFSGVVLYDFEGTERDALETMALAGVNCIRVRVWVDPYDGSGNGYGGGNCDLDTAIALGQRAAEYGMKLLVDFHYSDFWADPSKQQAPKAWEGMSLEEKTAAVYDYTADSLRKLMDAGVTPYMVQVGNETNNGFCGETTVPNVMKLMASAAQAIRAADSGILIAVHYTNPESANYRINAATLEVNGVDYDVFATSYYPYWHGTLENLREQLSTVAEKYGKKVMVVETSWAYTVENTDQHGNTIGEELSYDKPYPFTVQGQARCVSDVIDTVASLGDAGIGVFYWEPAWISVPGDTWEAQSALWEQYGSGWASSYSAEYDPDDAGVYYGGSACDNQALFDADGHPLESLKVFSYVRTGTEVSVAVDSVEPVYITVKLNNPIVLPDTIPAIYNDGSEEPVAVTWDDSVDLAAISASEVGTYPVHGTADGKDVVCYINMVEENYVENYSFEDSDYSMWCITDLAAGEQTDFQVKTTDAYSGSVSLHFWNADAVEFTVEQEITGLREGSYVFSIQAQGGDVGSDAQMYIYVIADGVRYEQSFLVESWRVWQNPRIEGITCTGGSMTVGVYVRTAGGGWGTMDDFLLNPEG